LKNKGQDSADTISLSSFGDDSSGLISGIRKQMSQVSEENKGRPPVVSQEKNETKGRFFVCPYPSCSQTFLKVEELKCHLFPTHANYQVFQCSLPDCGWQTQKKYILEFYHMEKHEYIRQCAENSPDDGQIYLPWKNIVDWERRYWTKCKTESARQRGNNKDSLLGNGLEDLKSDWDILSCLEEDTGRSEKFFEQIESWKNKEKSPDLSDTLSLASFRDESPCLITGARDLLRSICRQMNQESEENKGKLPGLLNHQ